MTSMRLFIAFFLVFVIFGCTDVEYQKCYEKNGFGSNYRYCVTDLAIARKDITLCDTIRPVQGGPHGGTTFYLNGPCYEKVAKSLGDESICDKTKENQKDWCYSGIGQAKENTAICVNLKDDAKNSCYNGIAVAKGDLSICDQSSGKASCYYSVAVNKTDPRICDKIGSEKFPGSYGDIDGVSIKDSCYRDTYTALAIIQKNVSLCDNISDSYFSLSCYRAICYSSKEPKIISECKEKMEKFNASRR